MKLHKRLIREPQKCKNSKFEVIKAPKKYEATRLEHLAKGENSPMKQLELF